MNKLILVLIILTTSNYLTAQELDLDDFYENRNLGVFFIQSSFNSSSKGFSYYPNNEDYKKRFNYWSISIDAEVSELGDSEFTFDCKARLFGDLCVVIAKLIKALKTENYDIPDTWNHNHVTGWYFGEYRWGFNCYSQKRIVINSGISTYFYNLNALDNLGNTYFKEMVHLAAGPYIRIDKMFNYSLAGRILYNPNFSYLAVSNIKEKTNPIFHELGAEIFTRIGFFVGADFLYVGRMKDYDTYNEKPIKVGFHNTRLDLKVGWRFTLD